MAPRCLVRPPTARRGPVVAILGALTLPPLALAQDGQPAPAAPFSPEGAAEAFFADPAAIGAAAMSVGAVTSDPGSGVTELRNILIQWDHTVRVAGDDTAIALRADLSVPRLVLEGFAREGEGYAARRVEAPLVSVAGDFADGERTIRFAGTQHGVEAQDYRWSSPPAFDVDPARPVTSYVRGLGGWLLGQSMGTAQVAATVSLTEDEAGRQVSRQGAIRIDGFDRGVYGAIEAAPAVTVSTPAVEPGGATPPPFSYEVGAQSLPGGFDLRPLFDALVGAADVPVGTRRTILPESLTGASTAKGTDFAVAVGEVVLDGLAIRQPAEPLLAVIDDSVTGAAAPDDPLGAVGFLTRVLAGYAAFSFDRFAIDGFSVEAPDAAVSVALVDLGAVSRDGVDQLVIEGVDVAAEGIRFVLSLFEVADLGFPARNALIALAEETGPVADGAAPVEDPQAVLEALPTLGLLALEGIRLAVDGTGGDALSLGAVRLEQDDFVGTVPTAVTLSVDGLSIPAGLMADADGNGEPDTAAGLVAAYGLDPIALDGRLSLRWDASTEALFVGPLTLAVPKVGSLAFDLVFAGVPRAVIEDPAAVANAVATISFASLAARYEDDGLVPFFLRDVARRSGEPVSAVIPALVGEFRRQVLALTRDEGLADRLSGALFRFLEAPDSLTLSSEPGGPVPLAQILGTAALAPGTLPALIGLRLEANAGN